MSAGRFKNTVWRVIFIAIILLAISSINILIMGIGLLAHMRDAGGTLAGFMWVSLGLMALISVYHITSMVKTKKRRADKFPANPG